MSASQSTVDRIQTILNVSDGSPVEELRSLAEDYARECRDANRRLSVCSNFLRVGNAAEALRLAETPPRLLDVCNALDFPERADWEEICRTYRLPVATTPNEDVLADLNRSFEELAPIEETLRTHRFLAFARAPLSRRIETLRKLAELDPANVVWGESLQELERARDREIEEEFARLERATGTPRAVKTAEATDLYRELTAAGRQVEAPSALSQRIKRFVAAGARQALEERAFALDARTEEAIRDEDSATMKRLVDEWKVFARDARRVGENAIPPSALDSYSKLKSALKEAESDAVEEQNFRDRMNRLGERIAAVENLSELYSIWDEGVAGVAREIPVGLKSLREERVAELKARETEKRMKTLTLILSGSAVFLAAAVALALMLIR